MNWCFTYEKSLFFGLILIVLSHFIRETDYIIELLESAVDKI